LLVKISLNDKYGYYELGVRRLQTLLELIGLRRLGNWKISAERSHVTQTFVTAWECDYESPYTPEDLKLILKAMEFAEIPVELKGKISEDFVINNVSYTKICDADVWIRVGFSIFSTWDKVYSRLLAKKLRVKEEDLYELGIQKLKAIIKVTPQDKVEQIKKIEHKILAARANQ
jgi:transcriptional regulator with XRE-family HTH domain